MPHLQAVVGVIEAENASLSIVRRNIRQLAVEINLHGNYSLGPLFGVNKYQKLCGNGAIILRSTCEIGDFN